MKRPVYGGAAHLAPRPSCPISGAWQHAVARSPVWVTFFEHIAQYERLYRALLGRKGSPWFVQKMRVALVDLIKERGRPHHGSVASVRPVHAFSDGLVPDLVSTLFVEAITWWLEQGRSYTPHEIATRTALLAAALFKEASTWQ